MKIHKENKKILITFNQDDNYLFCKGHLDENGKLINRTLLGCSPFGEYYWTDDVHKCQGYFKGGVDPKHLSEALNQGFIIMVNEFNQESENDPTNFPPNITWLTMAE